MYDVEQVGSSQHYTTNATSNRFYLRLACFGNQQAALRITRTYHVVQAGPAKPAVLFAGTDPQAPVQGWRSAAGGFAAAQVGLGGR